MIYSLIVGVTVVLTSLFWAFIVRCQTNALLELVRTSKRERQELEDRLMAYADKDAAILVHAQRDPEPGNVSYVDEREEARLSPTVGYGELDD